jgi:hypothetical protein
MLGEHGLVQMQPTLAAGHTTAEEERRDI